MKTYVFIDASNIIYGTRDEGWKVDFKKLIKYLKERFGAGKVYYFAGRDDKNLKQAAFYGVLAKAVVVFGNARRTAREIKRLAGIQFNELRVLRQIIAKK